MKKCKTCGKECKYELCNSCRAKERREKHKHDKCKHCGREGVYSKGLCYKHWKQLKEFGEFKDCNSRNKTDLNEIIFYDDYAEIIICDNNYNEKTRVLIDIEDSEKVKDFKWYIDKNEYIVSKCKKTGHKGLYLHRFIMNCPEDMVVDHINHNTLDNRKSNLRICTQHENTFNKKENYIPIFPFGCNNSQYQAVKKAMENQISVIQGPPGTGKTQTILNIIANMQP